MSSNEKHINPSFINRTNYEEYFLLYIDDELTPEEKAAVEKFVAAYPDLREELNILLSTKLMPEAITLNKEVLAAPIMQANELTEKLLLYMDSELPEKEKNTIAYQLSTDKNLQLQYALLQRTKADADEKIIFPYKKDLYRKPAVRPFDIWMRIAALLVVILGTALFILQQQKTALPISVAQHTIAPVRDVNIKKLTEQNSLPVATKKDIAAQPIIPKEESLNTAPIIHTIKVKPITPSTNDITTPQKDMAVVKENKLERIMVDPVNTINPPKQIISNLTVTFAMPDAYTYTAAPANTISTDVIGDSKNKVKLKGFLRKATRFIERTTNIEPINDDGELLIAAVSLKVK